MNRKLFILTSILIVALMGLLSMLYYWGRQSIELREAVFLDQVKISVDDLATNIEDNYFCFDLRAETSLPQLDSFFFPNPIDETRNEHLELSYITQDGQLNSREQIPIMAPVHMQVHLRFDFDDIPDFKKDSELTSFEKYIRESYDQYIYDELGNRLIDTTIFDSLLLTCVTPLFPEGKIAYALRNTETKEIVYSSNMDDEQALKTPDVMSLLFSNDRKLPELQIEMNVVNKAELFTVERWTIYIGAILLSLICIIFFFYLARIQMQQKKLLKLQRDFIHSMTHEFNTPISNIKLVAQNLFKSSDSKLQKSAEILSEEGRKLEAGINLVLTTALIEKEELLLQYQDIDVKSLLERTIEKNRESLEALGIKVNIENTSDPIYSKVDVFHIENVLQNLFNNVRKHSEANILSISTERVNGHVNIRFTDNGKGIREEDRKRIFGKFERTGDSNRKSGFGLGLYYSKMILEMHGGKIYHLANGDKGASFTIELPV